MSKKAVMYGGGNIGRGFIAQLFNLSGYEVVFIDVVDALVEEYNRKLQAEAEERSRREAEAAAAAS